MKATDLPKLAAPFPKEDIHWRGQQLRKMGAGHKVLALAYLDARDVMERLDAVCGPGGWQTKHRHMGGDRIACELGILVDGEWIWKSDGAGPTDVEGDKGAFSDSLKRAAVSFGIGRYLYDLGATWVPCEVYEGRDGKERFSKFKCDPWECVQKKETFFGPQGKAELKENMRAVAAIMRGNTLITTGDLERLIDEYQETINQAARDAPQWHKAWEEQYRELQNKLQAGPPSSEAAE